MKLPSERIMEIFREYESDSYTFAILEYLDEEYEKRNTQYIDSNHRKIICIENTVTGEIFLPQESADAILLNDKNKKTLEEVLAVIPKEKEINYGNLSQWRFEEYNQSIQQVTEAIKQLYNQQ